MNRSRVTSSLSICSHRQKSQAVAATITFSSKKHEITKTPARSTHTQEITKCSRRCSRTGSLTTFTPVPITPTKQKRAFPSAGTSQSFGSPQTHSTETNEPCPSVPQFPAVRPRYPPQFPNFPYGKADQSLNVPRRTKTDSFIHCFVKI
ncbi:hypothetical protein ISCGN_031292 [Ixodes scapularis]